MKIKSPSLENFAVWLVFLFYMSTNSFWAFRLFHNTNVFPAAASLLIILCFLAHYIDTQWNVTAEVLLSVLALYSVIVIKSSFSFKMILFYGICVIMMFDTEIAKERSYLKLFFFISLFFAVGSLINLFMPGLYRSVILPKFSGSSQYFRLVRWSNRVSYRIIAGFANQTSFNANHFVYGIGYLVCRRIVYGKSVHRKWIAFIILFICLVLCNKRAHLFFLFFSLAITYYVSSKTGEKGRRFLILIIVGVAALAFILFVVPKLNIGVFNKISTMLSNLEDEEDITSGRIYLYSYAIKHFLANPILGIGWEGFRSIPEIAGVGGSIMTHNIYLQLLCETGIVGLSIFMIFFVFAFVTAIKNCKLAGTMQDRFAASFCLFMQLFFLLYGMTGNPLYDPPYYIPYFFVCTYTFSLKKHLMPEAMA